MSHLRPRRRSLLAAGLLAFLLLAVAPSSAQVALSNGQPYSFLFPPLPAPYFITGPQGFTILAPPGTGRLVVTARMQPSYAAVTLLVRLNTPPGMSGTGQPVADVAVRPDASGLATVELSDITHPALAVGIYHIGFEVRDAGTDSRYFATLTATVEGGQVEPIFTAAQTRFEGGLDGWSLATAGSGVPGASVGDPGSELRLFSTGGNPDAYAWVRDPAFGESEWLVAPPKFLIDAAALNEALFEFDVARFSGGAHHSPPEIRVYGAGAGYRWQGFAPPAVNAGWERMTASVRPDRWVLFHGTATFADVWAHVERIEIRASYTNPGGTSGIDNIRLRARGEGPGLPVLPAVFSFSGGLDGWTRNFPADEKLPAATAGDAATLLVRSDTEGNPDGYIRMAESGGEEPDAFVAAEELLGDMSGLSAPRFEFDYRHESAGGATRPVTIRLIGKQAAFLWTGAAPGGIWSHQTALLDPAHWSRVAGEADFEAVLGNVVRIEVSADQAPGREWNCLDNFALLTSDTPALPRELVVGPDQIFLTGMIREPIAEPAMVRITSSNGPLRWVAKLEGGLSGDIELGKMSGDTPAEFSLTINTEGLGSGEHLGAVVFSAPGSLAPPVTLNVSVLLGNQPKPTPLLTEQSVVHVASGGRALAAGVLASIYGISLGGPPEGVAGKPAGSNMDRMPTNLNGVRVLVSDGSGKLLAEAPVLFASDGQINFQMPFEVLGLSQVYLTVESAGIRSAAIPVTLQLAAPGIFTFGAGRAAALNQNGSLNTARNPVARGEVLTVYMTGQGNVTPDLATGRLAPAFPLIRAPSDARARIGGVDANIDFVGLTPGLLGVFQVNLRPVFETPVGDQTVVISVAGYDSNGATVTVR